MKKIFLTLLFLVHVFGIYTQNSQTVNNKHYVKDWIRVAEFEKKSLPQSAAKVVDEILSKAIEEENSPQAIKAVIHLGKYDLAVDAQNDSLIFRNLRQMLLKSNDMVERAVLHSMLGELYLQYYRKDSWNINQRTGLGDFVPTDIKEWTRNIFYDKVIEHLNASIAPEGELINAKVESYTDVVELGNDSRRFFPSLYDFLARRAIEFFGQVDTGEDLSYTLAKRNITQESLFSPVEDFVKLPFNPELREYNLWALESYRKLLGSLKQRSMDESLLLTELEMFDYLRKLSSAHTSAARPALENLLEKWEGNDISVEVIDKLSQLYQQEIDLMDPADSIQAKEKTGELYELLKNTISIFPKYERISILENRLSQLTQPFFTISGASTFPIEGEKRLKVDFRNIRSLTAKLYRIHSPLDVLTERSKIRSQIADKREFLREFSICIPETVEYWKGETSFVLNAGAPGTYMLTFSTSPETDYSGESEYYFAVSDLAIFAREASDNRYEFFVVDRTTGTPVPRAEINIYKLPGNWSNSQLALDQSITSNNLGLAVYDKKIPNNDVFYHAVLKNDNGSMLSPLPLDYYDFSDLKSEPRKTTSIFTDRSLYRPGQTVFFKAIQVRTGIKEQSVIAGETIELVLRDANYREISKQTLTTNEFGSVAGEFVLPHGILSGNFAITSQNGTVNFQVEEYKRPTFGVSFDKIEGTYQFGEEITLKGKAENFSGIKLQNATVTYRITRQHTYWWRWASLPEYFTAGSATTGDDGRFAITFTPRKPDGEKGRKRIYTFNVEATVTDSNGETQAGVYSVTVGDISMLLHIDMNDRWERNNPEEPLFSAKNLDGQEIMASGVYSLYTVSENDSIADKVLMGTFVTGKQETLKKQLALLSSGKYRLKLLTEDERNNPVETEKDFILFSYRDKRPPVKTNDWLIEKNKTFADGEPAEVILGASDYVNVLYELWHDETVLERKWIKLNNETRLFSLPYKPEYKEGVELMLTYVKNEQFHAHRVALTPKKEVRELVVKLDVFRDRIRPGSGEEWRLSVLDAVGKPVVAEVLASMYDVSLDKIYPNQGWGDHYFSLLSQGYSPKYQGDLSFNPGFGSGYFSRPFKEVISFQFDRFNWYGYSLLYSGRVMFRSAKAGGIQTENYEASSEQVMVNEDMVVRESALKGVDVENERDSARRSPYAPQSPIMAEDTCMDVVPQIRRNFNETAFFYPQLRTNDKGETQIAFTVPGSNTRWRFRVLAHDKKLNSGKAEAYTVSQKELMVTPNMPRFLRQGDRVSISAKISNLSEHDIDGMVKIELFDPLTEQLFSGISVSNASQSFQLSSGSSSDASWIFDVPYDHDVIGIRIIAQAEDFSDGEQHALAVLPNRMLVTESMRMDVNGNETKSFFMERLTKEISATAQSYRLSLEFASNPAWYAVQALPVLSNPGSDNAVSWFSSYYANTLGAHIGKLYPKVTAMVSAWKMEGGTKETFLANLEKNQELKNVLLEETPWVMKAKNESEQKEKLWLLFDLNRSMNLTSSALDKLRELQTNQGGWSWFKGFSPSVSITQYILYGFQQLRKLNAVEFTPDILVMQSKAIEFIDEEARRRFESVKKYHKDWRKMKTISVTDLEYLYVRSEYSDFIMDSEVRKMTDFYLSVIQKNRTFYSLYEQSLIALLMKRENNFSILAEILDSLREHATVSEEEGMYWANNRGHVFMSQSAISAHTFIMEAFRAGGASETEMDKMKRWLLKQKQTQIWETTNATADAVYALLSTGSDWISSQGETVVTIGKRRVKPDSSEFGTGYFSQSWSISEINPEMGKVTVEHKGNAPAWGALYWQYYEDMDKITKTDASLDVEKLLFVEQSGPSGAELVRITKETPLNVGDKVVVRITVRTDRDMEFVNLKDMRAAAFEPANQVSGMSWQNGIPYYQTSKDASSNFYFNLLPRGTWLFEYAVYINRTGSYSSGITTIQSMYAPEFISHTGGSRIIVK